MKLQLFGKIFHLNVLVKARVEKAPTDHPYIVGNLRTVETLTNRWEIVEDDNRKRYLFHAKCDVIAEDGKCILCGEVR